MLSYIAPNQAADQSLHLLAATYFYPIDTFIATGNGTQGEATIGTIKITKKKDSSRLVVRSGGILKVSAFVGGFGVKIGDVSKPITMTHLTSFITSYGVITFDGILSGQKDITIYLYIGPNTGANATATAAPYQYYPLEVYEVY